MTNSFSLQGLKPPYYIHCALSKVKLSEQPTRLLSRNEFIELHLTSLENNLGRENLIFPTFNFDFKATKEFRPETDGTWLGALPSYLIGKNGYYRSHTPFFSCVSPNFELIRKYINCSFYEPFAENSIVGDVYKADGSFILYGADIPAATIMHFANHIGGPPMWRYDKSFFGKVIFNSQIHEVEVKFHARPLGLGLEYNHEFIENLLTQAGVVKELAPNIRGISAQGYVDVISDLTNADGFPLLDDSSREKVIPKLNRLGRRFIIGDFED